MTVATLLLALITAANSSSSGATSDPVLLDFHADWCGPCQKMRPAVERLARDGIPVRSINLDRAGALAERYDVQAVPTFIVVDGSGREIDRTSGLQPAAALARFYRAAKAKAQPPSHSNAHVGARRDSRAGPGQDDEEPADPRPRARRDDPDDRPEQESERSEPSFTNPHPAQTVVRIRVLGPNSIGYGSGTIIHSTPRESIVLTCAHIFKLEGRNRPVSPGPFPRPIMIDLFDGNLRGTNPAQVHFLETVEGKAIDYDFTRDVGLILIRPGRRLPASRVVPAHWQPKSKPLPMRMIAVGCPEGHDATVWSTIILNPRMQGLSGKPAYEAIECRTAPKQGRSGGGLFTTDGYLAGICNFAEPRGDVGLYATPRSIYSVLDRNNLAALYAPVGSSSGTLMADRRAPSQPAGAATPAPIARLQSPDRNEPERRRAGAAQGDGMLPPPHPSLLGIADPVASGSDRTPQAASGTARRIAWHPTPRAATADGNQSPQAAEPTNLDLDPAADHDHFGPPPAAWQLQSSATQRQGVRPDPAAVQAPAKSRWRAVKAAPADPMIGEDHSHWGDLRNTSQ